MGSIRMVVASFTVYGLHCAIVNTFGVFLPVLISSFGSSESATSAVGSIRLAVIYVSGIITGGMIDLFGCHVVLIFGTSVGALGLFLSSFVTSLNQMYFTLAVLSGFGLGMQTIPAVVSIQQSFSDGQRRVMTGLVLSSSGIGTFAFAPLCSYLIDIYSWRGAYMILSATLLNCIPMAMWLKSKPKQITTIPEKDDIVADSKLQPLLIKCRNALKDAFGMGILKDEAYRYFLAAVFVIAIGFHIPVILLANTAEKKGIPAFRAAVLVSIFAISDCIGRLLAGLVANRVSFFNIFVSVNFVAMFVYASMVFCNTFISLAVWSSLYGFTFGFHVHCLFSMGAEVVGVERVAKATGVLFSTLAVSLSFMPFAAYLEEVTKNTSVPYYFAASTALLSNCILFLYKGCAGHRPPLTVAECEVSVNNDDENDTDSVNDSKVTVDKPVKDEPLNAILPLGNSHLNGLLICHNANENGQDVSLLEREILRES